MEVDGQVMFGGFADGALVAVDHLLVVTVHEVDLDAGDAPFLEEGERLVHLFRDVIPARPEQDVDVEFVRVLHDGGDVNLGNRLGEVGFGSSGLPYQVQSTITYSQPMSAANFV